MAKAKAKAKTTRGAEKKAFQLVIQLPDDFFETSGPGATLAH